VALEKMKDDTKAMVMTMVSMEASYLTAEFFREILRTQDAEGDTGLRTLSGRQIKADSSGLGGSAEEAHLKQIANHVSAYLGVVCNQLKATIPKAIVHCLVLQAKKSLLDKFVEEVAGKDAESLRRLLGEDEQVTQRREMCARRLDLLQKAYGELTVSLGASR
jgi:hypothetical protein